MDDGVLVVSSGQPAPVFEAVEGAFDDVASAVGGAVVGGAITIDDLGATPSLTANETC